jgi:hypothetical protein
VPALNPFRGYPRSDAQLAKYGLSNPQRDFLKYSATRDRVVFFDDFLGDAINLDFYALAQSQTSTNFAVAVAESGTIAATTAATTTASVSLVTPAIWKPDRNLEIEVRLKVNTVASQIIEVGLVDGVPGSDAPAVTDIDVPTFAGTNAAIFQINTAQTHAGFAFATLGAFTGQTHATTLLTTSNSPITGPTANTFFTVNIQTITNVTGKSMAYCWVNGQLVAKHDTAAAGHINGQQALAFWIYFQTIAAAAKIPTIDYIWISADRAPGE